jgi:hypothetical protein
MVYGAVGCALGSVTYLQREARMSPDQNFTEVGRGMPFMARPDGWALERNGVRAVQLRIRRFSLGDGSVETGRTFLVQNRVSDCAELMHKELSRVNGVAVYARDLAPGESYSWK